MTAAMTRCEPAARPCAQAGDCARTEVPHDPKALTMDGTVCKVGGWCPMFVDRRGAALVADARLAHLDAF